jgi:hypothetical protein
MRCTRKGIVGSNPTLSARLSYLNFVSERAVLTKPPWYTVILFVLLFILLFPLILLIAVIFVILWLRVRYVQRPRLLRRVKKEWLPQSKFILFVYSDNELWKNYAEKNIIPKIASHSVILNWSRRKDWISSNSLEARLFRNLQWGKEWIWRRNVRMGGQDYNHMAIIFKPWNKPKTISFWKAFKDYKFEKYEKLKAAEQELYAYLEN